MKLLSPCCYAEVSFDIDAGATYNLRCVRCYVPFRQEDVRRVLERGDPGYWEEQQRIMTRKRPKRVSDDDPTG